MLSCVGFGHFCVIVLGLGLCVCPLGVVEVWDFASPAHVKFVFCLDFASRGKVSARVHTYVRLQPCWHSSQRLWPCWRKTPRSCTSPLAQGRPSSDFRCSTSLPCAHLSCVRGMGTPKTSTSAFVIALIALALVKRGCWWSG